MIQSVSSSVDWCGCSVLVLALVLARSDAPLWGETQGAPRFCCASRKARSTTHDFPGFVLGTYGLRQPGWAVAGRGASYLASRGHLQTQAARLPVSCSDG